MLRRLFEYLFSTICFLFLVNQLPAQIVVTVAGTGFHGTTGDGGPAVCAGVLYPTSVATDAAGNLYITTSNSVRKVTAATGIITTIAGSDTYGYSGDGGPAVNALLKNPYGVCVDGSGNVYITTSNSVRKITAATGIITTIAGIGTSGYSGDGGPATAASFNNPEGICVDAAGNLYIADFQNSRIRKITAATGIVTTIGGIGSTSYSGDGGPAVNAGIPYPVSVCVDHAGNVYETEVNSNVTCRVRKISQTTGIITTVAGKSAYAYSGDGGPAVNASLFDPTGICVDPGGNLYIAEYDDSRIREVDAVTGIITTIAGTGTNGYSGDGGQATSAQFNNPMGICMDAAGNLYVADNQNVVVRKIYFSGAPPPATPSNATISISTPANSVCIGQTVNFTATLTNGGASPVYQWEVNGSPAGTNSPSFSPVTLANGDVVDCKLIVAATGCTPAGSITSNGITMTVNPMLTPSISITVNAPPVICTGTPVTFTAQAVDGGANAGYQWLLNGAPTGSNSAVYRTTQLQNGDQVECMLIPDPATPCLTAPTATSNAIALSVSADPAPTVQITASSDNVCQGVPVTFQAHPQNGGTIPAYIWTLNGVQVGDHTATYTNDNLSNGDQVSCRLIANPSSCPTTEKVMSDTLSITVKAPPGIQFDPPEVDILEGQAAHLHATLTGSVNSYQWNPADALVNASTLDPVTIPLILTTKYQLLALGANGCTATGDIIVKVLGKFNIPNSFTPNGDGKNDVFRIPPGTRFTLKNLSIFDRWGSKLFSTGDVSQGWDGSYKGQPCPAGTYVFMVSGSDGTGPVFVKGTVILVR